MTVPVLPTVTGVAGAVAVLLRLSLWRSHPGSRPLTVALALLMLAAVLTQPAIISDDWVDQATPESVRLANVSNLIGDLVAVAAACCLVLTVGHAWGQRRLMRWTGRSFAATSVLLLVLYAVSEAHVTPTMYIGNLGGLASVYIYVTAAALLVANLAVLGSLIYAFPHSTDRTRISLLPMAIGAIVGTALIVLLVVDGLWPNRFGGWYVEWSWRIAAVMVLAYAVSGILGYLQLRGGPSGRDREQDERGEQHQVHGALQ
ncbi:hypothetical protein [Nocardia sp. NPDC020380]|uniref:hypothetical protein n=1 Tax=Nocardia sp. NPDC020380 TaxID=3364309 RepID=UPI003791743C